MSKATKRKHVTKELVDNYELPTENQQIVKVIAGRGNNLHEVIDDKSEKFLVSMPPKFRKNVWIKRGNYVYVEPIVEGNKVKAEIVHILMHDQIRELKKQGKWPEAFCDAIKGSEENASNSDDEPPENPNRPNIVYSESESSSEEESSGNENETKKDL